MSEEIQVVLTPAWRKRLEEWLRPYESKLVGPMPEITAAKTEEEMPPGPDETDLPIYTIGPK